MSAALCFHGKEITCDLVSPDHADAMGYIYGESTITEPRKEVPAPNHSPRHLDAAQGLSGATAAIAEEVDMGIAGRRNEVYAIGLDGCEGSEYLHALIFNALDTLEPQGDTGDGLRQWLRSAPAIGDTLEADCGACEPITRIA